MNIVFFIDSLRSGGKERRMLELLYYIKENTDYNTRIVLTKDLIHYKYIFDWGIPIDVIKRKYIKWDPRPYFSLFRICSKFQPNIIHTWSIMTTFYAIPSKLYFNAILVSSMINDTNKNFKRYSLTNFMFKVNCIFSNIILSNSKQGLLEYKLNNKKAKVIYNGVRLDRFRNVESSPSILSDLGINSTYTVIMVASFLRSKDYDTFVDTAKELLKSRNDVTFLGIGDGPELKRIKGRIIDEEIKNVILPGQKSNIEKYISASDIGLLFSYREGISNAIIEYMALGKAVITTDTTGGSKEIIDEGNTGFCTEPVAANLSQFINDLLNNDSLRIKLGENGYKRIEKYFTLDRMGSNFIKLYSSQNN